MDWRELIGELERRYPRSWDDLAPFRERDAPGLPLPAPSSPET